MILDRHKRDINIKELLKNIMSLWSYWILCAEMADLALRHNNSRKFIHYSSRHFSIAQTIVCLIIPIYAQKSTATDWYWWRFGPAKFVAATAGFEARSRRAVSSSILALICHVIHKNVDNDVVYHRTKRDGYEMTASHYILRYNVEVLARRHMPWFEVWRTTVLLFT